MRGSVYKIVAAVDCCRRGIAVRFVLFVVVRCWARARNRRRICGCRGHCRWAAVAETIGCAVSGGVVVRCMGREQSDGGFEQFFLVDIGDWHPLEDLHGGVADSHPFLFPVGCTKMILLLKIQMADF